MRFHTFSFGSIVKSAGMLGILVFMVLFCHQVTQAQTTTFPKTDKPNWVKTMPLPTVLFKEAEDSTAQLITYREGQVNYLTNETYERTVCRVLAGGSENRAFNFSKTYNPADDSVQLIGFKWTRSAKTRTQWGRSSDHLEEYQINHGLFHSVRTVQFYGNDSKDGDFFEIELLVKNLRDDISQVPIPEYGFENGTYNYIRIISPSRLNTREIQGMPSPKVDSIDGQFEYIWEGMGAFNHAENNPAWRYMGSRFSASSFENNKELLQWKMPLYELNESSRIAVRRKQEALTKGLNDLESKIVTILNYVQDSITYQEYGLYAPRMPDRTISDGYGDCKSKSLLGVELLKEAGVQSWPIMVNMQGYKEQFDGFISPQKFNHCVIQYVHENDTFTIDATTQGQGDRLGEQYYEPFKRGLRLQKGEVEEVSIKPAKASTLRVYDVYRAADHSITRKVVATGNEADKLRTLYKHHGLKGLHKAIKYSSRAETGYEYTLDLGYNYRSGWKRQGPAVFNDQNSKGANKVEVVIFYAINTGFPDDFTEFDLDHFRTLVKEYPIAEEIDEVGFKEPISITHRLKIAADDIQSVCGDSLTDTQTDLRIGADVVIYHNRTFVHKDSVVLEQMFKVPTAPSLEDAREYNRLLKEVVSERNRMRELPKLYNDLLPEDDFHASWGIQMVGMVGSMLLGLFSIAFFILGMIHLTKGKRRKRRLKEIKALRSTALLATMVILFVCNARAQSVSLTKMPAWVDTYAPDSSLKGNKQIQIIQKEAQVNDLTKEVFYRNTYEVNRKGPAHTCFLTITYDAEVETVELVAFHVDRKGKQVSMMPGLIKRNERKVTSAHGIVLSNKVTLYFHNDLFKSRDLVTIAYVKKAKEHCQSPLSEYSFEAREKGLACRYVFSVISKPDALYERHFQGFLKPSVLSVQNGQKWVWDQVLELKTSGIFYTDPKTPSWYIENPHVYVFSSSAESQLAKEIMKLPRFLFQEEALKLLFKYSDQNKGTTPYEKVCSLDRYIRDSLIIYDIALVNDNPTYTHLVKMRIVDGYSRSVLFSKALLSLGVESDLLLVREGGLDSLHAEVLSTEIFNHAIVRYQIDGHTCYFDPAFEGLGKHLSHYRKYPYQYGLNLTSPGDEAQLFKLPRVAKNRLTIHDTIQHSGKLERWMFLEGDFASDLRDGYYTEDYPFRKRVMESWGITNVFPSDVFRLHMPVNDANVDSFEYKDAEGGGVSLYLSFDINAGDSIDPSDDSGHFRELGLCEEFRTLYSNDDLDQHSVIRRAEIDLRHTVTVPDQVLHVLDVPDIRLKASTAAFERSASYSKGLFTLDLRYVSTTDFMTMDLYDGQFYMDFGYYAVPHHTLDPDDLMSYQKRLKRESRRGMDTFISYIGLALVLCGAAIALFGLYKTILGFRKKRKRKARLKRLIADA